MIGLAVVFSPSFLYCTVINKTPEDAGQYLLVEPDSSLHLNEADGHTAFADRFTDRHLADGQLDAVGTGTFADRATHSCQQLSALLRLLGYLLTGLE